MSTTRNKSKFTPEQIRDMRQSEEILAGLNHKLLFQPTRFGAWPGFVNKCPVCEVHPPREAGRSGSRRWRWIAVHIATEHGG